MPSRHPRIAVVADPALEAALDRAAAVFGRQRKRASLLRQLALAGATTLSDGEDARAAARLVERLGVGPPRASLSDLVGRVAEMGPPNPADRRPGQRALEEQRSDRV